MKTYLVCAVAALSVRSLLAAGDHIDVSKIVDKGDAESILEEKVNDPTPFNGEGKDGYYSKCSYYSVSPGKSLIIRLQQPDAEAIGPRKELGLVEAENIAMKSVDGIGDEAEMYTEGGDTGAASRLLMLYVVKGEAFVVVGISGFADDGVALEKAESVAQKIVAHL